MKRDRFHRAARREFMEAFRWYRERSEDAAIAFSELVEHAVHQIQELPLAWPVWPGRPDIRVRVLLHYPYSIIYHLGVDEIVILAVAHQKRRPGYWIRRAPPIAR